MKRIILSVLVIGLFVGCSGKREEIYSAYKAEVDQIDPMTEIMKLLNSGATFAVSKNDAPPILYLDKGKTVDIGGGTVIQINGPADYPDKIVEAQYYSAYVMFSSGGVSGYMSINNLERMEYVRKKAGEEDAKKIMKIREELKEKYEISDEKLTEIIRKGANE